MALTKPAKLPLPESFASLCGYIATLRQGLGLLAEAIDAKADTPTSISMTIPTTGWSQDNTAVYPYYYDFAVQGITADNRAEVTLAVSSLQAAADCGICPTNETIAGYIRLRAMSVPTASMVAVALIS